MSYIVIRCYKLYRYMSLWSLVPDLLATNACVVSPYSYLNVDSSMLRWTYHSMPFATLPVNLFDWVPATQFDAFKIFYPSSHNPSKTEWDRIPTDLTKEVDRVIRYSGLRVCSEGPVGDFLDIIMVQWKITLNERKLILEIHPFSTKPWLWEAG